MDAGTAISRNMHGTHQLIDCTITAVIIVAAYPRYKIIEIRFKELWKYHLIISAGI